MSKTKAKNFKSKMLEILSDYEEQEEQVLEDQIKSIAKAAAKEIKANAKASFDGTVYYKGWTSKTETTRLGTTAIIYNREKYMLAHLLEYGHAKRGGGRVEGKEHIYPVWEELTKTLDNKLGVKL